MVKQSDYREPEVRACLSVLLEIMTILGEFRENIIIVGGNVPPLLIVKRDALKFLNKNHRSGIES